jgi:epoxyqueuosine reductase QueG
VSAIPKLKATDNVTVCDKCFRACCWQGEFMCDEARTAGITVKTVAELRAGKFGEHEHYWSV